MAYAVLVASAFLIEVALNTPMGSLPLALVGDHVPASAIALVVGAGPIAALAVSVPIGGLADRFGRLPTIRIAACLCMLSVGALAYVHDPLLDWLIMAVRGMAITAYVTAEFAYASAIVAPERAVSATATLGMVGNLSFATAPAAGYWRLRARRRARSRSASRREGPPYPAFAPHFHSLRVAAGNHVFGGPQLGERGQRRAGDRHLPATRRRQRSAAFHGNGDDDVWLALLCRPARRSLRSASGCRADRDCAMRGRAAGGSRADAAASHHGRPMCGSGLVGRRARRHRLAFRAEFDRHAGGAASLAALPWLFFSRPVRPSRQIGLRLTASRA